MSTPYLDKIIEDRECGFQHNGSLAAQTFCICQILEEKLEYGGQYSSYDELKDSL
jgi:hypothetical protein